ncbi:MAG: hypothetical protein AB2813_13840, partial [Candidatus Sedimenticola endophacoides]
NGQADSARKEETAHLINEAKDISANAMRQANELLLLQHQDFLTSNFSQIFCSMFPLFCFLTGDYYAGTKTELPRWHQS